VTDPARTPSATQSPIEAWVARTAQRIGEGAAAARLVVPPELDGFGPAGTAPASSSGDESAAPEVASPLGERLAAMWARVDAEPRLAACFTRQDRRGAARQAQALASDASLHADGALANLLVAHKDLFAQEGVVATFAAASALRREGVREASVLGRLRAAGAVDLGGVHLSELAMGPTGFSETFGFIANPAHPGRVSGGSSSGSAAVVAAGLADGAIGTDTGGSIRIPAAFCGVVGLKPSPGLVPVDGVLPLSRTLDCVGPLARDVPTAAALLDAITGHARGRGPYAAATIAPPARTLELGMLALSSLPVAPSDEVVAAMERVARALGAAGHAVRELAFDDLPKLNALAGTLFLCEAAAVHGPELLAHPEWFGPQVRYRLLQGRVLDGAAYVAAHDARAAWHARWQSRIEAHCDVLLMPVAPTPAPLQGDDARLGDVTRVLERNAQLGSYASAFNYLGLPVLSLPLGETLGVQVVGRRHRDADLLQAGHAIARTLRS